MLRTALGGPLPAEGADPEAVIEQLATAVEPALVATVGPRYFGFVIGGALDAATCADVLATGWDQIAFNAVELTGRGGRRGGGRRVAEGACSACPADASFGFVTGGQGANTVGLAAARHHVLAEAGWDVEARGLAGARACGSWPSEERHATIDRSLRLLGFGRRGRRAGRRRPRTAPSTSPTSPRLLDAAPTAPTIVCLQAGNVNTGACDDLARRVRSAHAARRLGPRRRRLRAVGRRQPGHAAPRRAASSRPTRGRPTGTSGSTSPTTPATPSAPTRGARGGDVVHRRLPRGHGEGRCGRRRTTSPSRRGGPAGFATWAALRELGRRGVAELVDRCCALARRFADRLGAVDGVEIANDVVLNQVLVGFGDDDRTDG